MPPRASVPNPVDIGAAGPMALSTERLVDIGRVALRKSQGLGSWQVGIRDTSNSEPLMRHRKDRGEVETGLLYRVQNEIWEKPAYRPSGLRCRSGVNLIQAFARNLGTCRFDGNGETQVEDPRG